MVSLRNWNCTVFIGVLRAIYINRSLSMHRSSLRRGTTIPRLEGVGGRRSTLHLILLHCSGGSNKATIPARPYSTTAVVATVLWLII